MQCKRMRGCAALLLLSVLLFSFCACGKTRVPEQRVQIDLETCAITSNGQMAETESGYYAQFRGKLYYADESDLTNWVQVCNEPDCRHWDESCPAKMMPYGFWIQDNRIYSVRQTVTIEEIPTAGDAIYSMAPDGTDLRLEYPLEAIPRTQRLPLILYGCRMVCI